MHRWAAAWIIGPKTINVQLYAAIAFDGGNFSANIKTFGIGKTIIAALIADINHHFAAFGGAVATGFFTIIQDHYLVFDAILIEVGGFDGFGIQTVALGAVIIAVMRLALAFLIERGHGFFGFGVNQLV